MTDSQVRYCTTEDGVRIAYCWQGEGPALVMTPMATESFSLYHLLPEVEQFLNRLRTVRRVVLYDDRGTGLSQRDAVLTPATSLFDLAAVVAATGEKPVAVWATMLHGFVAVRLAARRPDSVERLVLFGVFARRSDAFSDVVLRSLLELTRADWKLAAQTIGDMSTRQADPGAGLRWGEVFQQSTTGDTYASFLAASIAEEDDVRAELPSIRVPTLVMHHKDDPNVPLALGQEVAAAIPDAIFVPVDGVISHYAYGDTDAVLRVALPFLKRAEPGVGEAVGSGPALSAFRTILFTDLAGHTEMMSRLGDERGRAALREHEGITRELLKAHGGTEVKTMGDGFMASFGSVTKAVECAIALQQAFEARNNAVGAGLAPPQGTASRAPTEPLHVRIGLNTGEPIEEEGDLFGATVILAARIAANAGGGEILVANAVRELCAGKGFLFADRGEFAAKGFAEPLRLYEVRWRQDA